MMCIRDGNVGKSNTMVFDKVEGDVNDFATPNSNSANEARCEMVLRRETMKEVEEFNPGTVGYAIIMAYNNSCQYCEWFGSSDIYTCICR